MRMPKKKIKSESLRKNIRKKVSARQKINGTTERPRLCVVKTNKNLSAMVVDDTLGKTLFSMNTFGKKAIEGSSKNKEGAKVLAQKLGATLKEKGISKVVFDKNGKAYAGVLKTFADEVRSTGVVF